MESVLIIIGGIGGLVSLMTLYIALFTAIVEADYLWQRLLIIIAMCGVSTILLILGGVII